MASDVKTTFLTASGNVFAGRTRVKAVHYHSNAVTGELILRNGGASAEIKLRMGFHQNTDDSIYIPDEGILFDSGCYAELTDMDNITVFFN
jgi:hypothetical protein